MPGAVVQSFTNANNSATFTNTVTLSGITANNLLVAQIAVRANDSTAFTTPTGWTLLAESFAGSSLKAATYYRIADGSETGITFDWNGTSDPNAATVVEYSGLDSTSPLEDSDSPGTTNGDLWDCGSATPVSSNGMAIALMPHADGRFVESDEIAISNSYTIDVQFNNSGANACNFAASKTYTTTAAQTPDWSSSQCCSEGFGVVAVFKEAGGGGTTHEGSITVSPTMGVSDSTNIDYATGVNINPNVGLSKATNIDYNPSVDVSPNMGVSEGAATDYNTDATLASTLGITGSAALIYDVAATLAATYGISTDADVSVEGSITLALSSGLSKSAETTYNTDIATSATFSVAPTALVDYNTALTLALQSSLSAALANVTFDENIAVSWSQGLTPTVIITLEGDITLATTQGISTDAVTTYNGSIALATSLGINAVTQWLMEAGITMATIAGITADFDTVSFNIVTPDGRTLVIKFENRTCVINSENRTLKIN